MSAEDLPRVLWVKEVDGVVYESWLREDEPGVYKVSRELMHQMMRELGWEPKGDDA